MNVLIALDSFKGSLSASEATRIVAEEFAKNGYDVVPIPVSDGGDGVLEILSANKNTDSIKLETYNAQGRDTEAAYLLCGDEACLSVSTASGIQNLNKNLLNPLVSSTYGTGVVFKYIVDAGIKKIKYFLGGSATVDGGTGFMAALGVEFYSGNVKINALKNNPLLSYDRIEWNGVESLLSRLEVELIVDVKNVILGKNGAVNIYGPQKGIEKNDLFFFNERMNNWVELLEKTSGRPVKNVVGLGAAGGAGLPLFSFSNCKVTSGSRWFFEYLRLAEKISDSGIVITGEGSIDHQTLMGKIPGLIAKQAKEAGKTTIGICGKTDGAVSHFFDYLISIVRDLNVTEEYAIRHANVLLQKAAKIVVNKLR
ncbi:MAG: glycerate kinase [Chlorobi bacterium]|nr:glycerate kinase [Chlorobiota bacterium]